MRERCSAADDLSTGPSTDVRCETRDCTSVAAWKAGEVGTERAPRTRGPHGPSRPTGCAAPRRDPAFLNFAPRAAAQPVFPFPSAGDVRQGMEIQSLQASFGRPTIRATTMERETLVETYVYVKNEPRSATIVRLKDGKVVEAQNGIY